jgi:hypothetical protein
MYEILNKSYEQERGEAITIGNLGYSTEDLSFFVTATLTSSVSSSYSVSNTSLLNKLISLSSRSEYAIVDSVLQKI